MQRKISLLQSNLLASVYILGTCFYFNDTNLIKVLKKRCLLIYNISTFTYNFFTFTYNFPKIIALIKGYEKQKYLRILQVLNLVYLLSLSPSYSQTGNCSGFQYFKSPDYASNNTYYNQWKVAIGENPDNKVNFESYSVGDNLKDIVLGPRNFKWSNLDGGYIIADNDIGSAPPRGLMGSKVEATKDGGDDGDNTRLSWINEGVSYVGFYIIDVNGGSSASSSVEVSFNDNTKCTISIDHTDANCQCEEFLGLIAPSGKLINQVDLIVNGASRYGLDDIEYGIVSPPICTPISNLSSWSFTNSETTSPTTNCVTGNSITGDSHVTNDPTDNDRGPSDGYSICFSPGGGFTARIKALSDKKVTINSIRVDVS